MSNGAITFEDLMRLQATLDAQPLPRVMSSSHLPVRTVPRKVHKKRRNQSEAYHQRIQKKWAKRYGTDVIHFAYMINPQACGMGFMGGRMVVMDERMAAELRHQLPPRMPNMNGEHW